MAGGGGARLLFGGGGGCDGGGYFINSQTSPSDGFFVSGSASPFMGSSSLVSFEDACGVKRLDRSFFHGFDQDDNGDDDLDDYLHQPEKKRRLTAEQVQFLETSFEAENKLEPERKVQLAKELGLQPRQVAIWFQNRRARWKTKQLEKDFDSLQNGYDNLKADYENLLKEKEKLKAEVLHLKDKLNIKEEEEEQLEPGYMDRNQSEEPIGDSASENDDPPQLSVLCLKQELSSTRSDMFDSDSLCFVDGGHLAIVERGDSSYVFEPEHSDLSQDEEDDLSKTFMPTYYLSPKIEDADFPESPAYSCNFELHVEEPATWFWSF